MIYNFVLTEDACKNGDLELALLMIGKGANDWNTGLYMACQGGHIELVELMIENGAYNLSEGLYHACKGGYKDIIELLLLKSSGLKDFSTHSKSSEKLDVNDGFLGACEGGHKELALFMIEKGADDFNRGFTNACYGQHMELVLLMIKNIREFRPGGVNHGPPDWNAGVANVFASMSNPNKKGHAEIMNLMIENGANDWKTCLMYACEIGDRKLAELMISRIEFRETYRVGERSANLNMALSYSCEGGHKELVEYIISKMSAIDMTFDWNWGFLNACRKGYKDIVLLLIDKGADDFNEGMSCACYGGHKDIVLLMIDKLVTHGIIFRETPTMGLYPLRGAERQPDWNSGLYNACEGGHKDLALLMIEYGATNLNMGLQMACRRGQIELALLMIEKGESIDNYDMYLRNNHIYYLVQKGVSEFEEYDGVANAFRESQSLLTNMLKLVLNNDLISEILLY